MHEWRALINISGCHITKSSKLGEPRILPNLNDRRQRRLKSNHHHHYILKSWSFKLHVLIRIMYNAKKHMLDTHLVFLSALKSIPKRGIIFVNYKNKGYMNYCPRFDRHFLYPSLKESWNYTLSFSNLYISN